MPWVEGDLWLKLAAQPITLWIPAYSASETGTDECVHQLEKIFRKRDNTIDENTLRVQWFPACTKKCHIFAPDLTSQSLLSMTVRIHVDIHSQFPSLNNSIADDRLMGSPDLAMDAKYCYSTSFSNLRHVRLHQILPSCCMTG